jgi:type IV secretion system protein VirB10
MNTNTIHPAVSGEAAKPAEADRADRDIPQLNTKRKTSTLFRLAIVVGMVVMIVVLAIGAAAFMQRLKERKAEQIAAQSKARPTTDTDAAPDFDSLKKRVKSEEAATMPDHQGGAGLPPPAAALETANQNSRAGASFAETKYPGAGGSGAPARNNYDGANAGRPPEAAQPRPETLEQRELTADLLVVGGNKGTSATRNAATDVTPQSPQLPELAGAAQRTSALGEQLKPTELRPTSATRYRNLDLMLLAGTTIPCGQQTYIVSTTPGQATCVVSKDVYSANGSTLLIERGSQVLGERQQPLQLGQEVMPVLWNRIVTPPPHNVVIDINSLATDALGASGLLAYVDTHFRERFGAAIMLSLISDAGQAAANAANNSGENTIRLTTTAGAGQDLASKALDKTINIPPTGYSLQGSAINIFLARDVDFGRVYELVRY